MLKAIGKVYAKEGLTFDEFKSRWLNEIMPKIKELPKLRKYVINIVIAATGEEPGYQGTVELWWDSLRDMQDAFSTPLGKEAENLAGDITRKITTVITEEHIII